eukprot:TRINITY_DN14952_c0_g1_i2.p1 TRINITY_DN14952_c0_g1~~TRINITY_DN14952_c0_g1_i2.p1  ORF type:complete len:447 (+),score=59.62 TRINITY_DN14952_c0_g1_i2:91-1431(+)
MEQAGAAAAGGEGREGPRGQADEVGGEEGLPREEGLSRGVAAAALPAAAAPAAAGAAVYEYCLATRRVRRAPEFAGAAGVRSCSVGKSHVALVDARGTVLSAGSSLLGELGTEDRFPRDGLSAARLPWPAAAVRSGNGFSVAVRRGGGDVSWWGLDRMIGGGPKLPAGLQGLPIGDPVALLDASESGVVAVTASGVALAWGAFGNGMRIEHVTAAPIAALTGRHLRHLAYGFGVVAAETEDGVLLMWQWGDQDATQAPQPQPPNEAPAFPLRCLVVSDLSIWYADAVGRVWQQRAGGYAEPPGRTPLPETQRAVRLAIATSTNFKERVAVLTERGELWDCTARGPRSISAARPELPRGLLPYGGPAARRILLVQDSSGGKARLVLFARIAMRIGVPSDPVRELLPPFVVHEAYITGPASDPFSISGDSGVGGGEERSEEGDGPDEA